MYVGKYQHGTLDVWVGSKTRADIVYAQSCDDLLTQGYTSVVVIRNYSEYKCHDDTCKYSPCGAVSLQSDRPAIPQRYVK